MRINTANSIIRIKNAEQILGCKEERYFSAGYKKVSCELSNCRFTDDRLTACLKLGWGKNWSIKKGKETDQHMGSIDSSLVAIRALELFLATKYNLSRDQISSCLIRRIEFKTKPCPQSLNQGHDVELTSIQSFFDKENLLLRRFKVLVKNFCFMIDLELSSKFNILVLHDEKITQGMAYPVSYYNVGYKSTSVDIENVFLNLETSSIVAKSTITHSVPIEKHGLGMTHLKLLTFVEYLSIAGQLTQMLLYKLENITREESNNMWVRSLTANFHPERINQSDEVFSMAHFSEYNVVTIKNENWRTVTAKFEIGNIEGFAKVCHII